MARTEIFVKDDSGGVQLWRTDLTGYGDVKVGEEFTIRELHQRGRCGLVKDGIRRKVRVVSVEEYRRTFHVHEVETIEETAAPETKKLF